MLLHGFLSSSKYWTKLQPQLSAAGYRVITIDLLGFGAAPKPRTSEYDYEAHVQHITETLDRLDIHDRFILIGHSMGALLATKYTSLHEDRIESLILLHPPLYMDIAEAKATLRETGRFYRFLLDSKYRSLGWIMMKTFMRYRLGKHTKHSRERSMRNVIETADIFGDLDSITTQTLLLVGTRDRPEYAQNVSIRQLSDNIEIMIEDLSHHSPVQQPLFINRLVQEFVDQ